MDKQQRVNEIGRLVTDYLYHGGCCEKTMTFILLNTKGLTGNDRTARRGGSL
jgi:hypothetical protein